MALLMNVEFANGLTCQNAYLKVISVGGGKEKAVIELAVSKGKTFSDAGNFIEKQYYDFVPSVLDDAPNFIKQAYEYIKSLSEFIDATDC
jgi:hypothetical protein